MLIFGFWLRLKPLSISPDQRTSMPSLIHRDSHASEADETMRVPILAALVRAGTRCVVFEGVFRAVKADRRAAPINMNGPVDHALQAQPRPPSSHPQDAFEGNELAAVRGRPAAARLPDTLPSSSQSRSRRKTL